MRPRTTLPARDIRARAADRPRGCADTPGRQNIPAPGTKLKEVKATLITKHGKESSAPAWSPDGSKLAYSTLTNGVRQIWIYDFDTRQERQLTQGPSHKENPTWGPNSLHIIFNSSTNSGSDLYLINLNQPEAEKISSGPGEKRFPSWEM